MKMRFYFLILFNASIYTQYAYAQWSTQVYKDKPVSAEDFLGNERQYFQIMVNKIFTEKRNTGFLSLTSYSSSYQNDHSGNEFLNNSLIYHHLFKGISLNSGATYTSLEGLKTFIGLQYMFQNRIFSLVYLPAYYFINANRISNLALVECKPSINQKWAVYTRMQLHYNYNLEKGNHFRSYVYSRVGLSYTFFSFGLADNFDCYGADKKIKNNFGVFLKLDI